MSFLTACGGACVPRDSTTDTVRVSLPPAPSAEEEEVARVAQEDAKSAAEAQRVAEEKAAQEALEAEALEAEALEAEALEAEAEAEAEKEKASLRAAEEAEEQRLRESAEAEARESAAAEEARRVEEEERAAAEAAAQGAIQEEEAARKVAQETETRKYAVAAFLKLHGYKGVGTAKQTLFKTTYPLHEAAKRNELEMVKMLVAEGADPAQKNSRGKTALQRAMQEDKKHSHKNVVDFLEGLTTASPSVGGA